MAKKIDLTGKQFGQLTVLQEDKERDFVSNEIKWICRCSCGKEISVRGSSLRNGNTKSCGCSKGSKIDLTGKKINSLTVLSKTDERDSAGGVLWLCQCECGKKIKVATTRLKNQTIQSCGCKRNEKNSQINSARKQNLIGKRFGHLVVLQETPNELKGIITWLCQCDCGNQTIVRASDLRSGNTRSCGCQRKSSYGETKIQNLLDQSHINYEKEKTFNSCRFQNTDNLARFDFYLPQFNTIIEYDGEQHYQNSASGFYTNEKLALIKEHDCYKTKWCIANNIHLIRIPYTHYDSICIADLLPQTSSFLIGGFDL